jgi:hypothetical protein
LGETISVKIVIEPMIFWGANYGGNELTLNVGRLGHRFFNEFPGNIQEVMDLLIHEYGHQYSSDHLSEAYYSALTRLGAKSTLLALRQPALFPGVQSDDDQRAAQKSRMYRLQGSSDGTSAVPAEQPEGVTAGATETNQ